MKKVLTLFLILARMCVTVVAFASCGEKATEGLEYYAYGEGYSVGIKDGKYLDKIVIPKEHEGKKVVAIAKKGFVGCENAVTVSLPDTITEIGESAFQNCYKLESIVIPNGVASIGKQAFKGCKALTSIDIPSGVTSIGEYAFSNCKALSLVTISDTVSTIDSNAFEGCTSLVSITIPKGVSEIGDATFKGCTALTAILVVEENQNFKSVDGVLYSKDGKKIYQYPVGLKPTSYEGPSGLESIGGGAFEDCELLTQIKIPSTVTTVGENAFKNCPIENATMPTCVIKHVAKNVLRIVDINGGETIEEDAFRAYPMLKRVTISSAETKTIGDSAFYNCASLSNVVLSEGLEVIDEYAFKGCGYLTGITLPSTLKVIGASAFKDCNRLSKIVIPFDVETIGMYAFEGCLSLKGIYCRGAGRPSGWDKWWNVKDKDSNFTVTWRYDGE